MNIRNQIRRAKRGRCRLGALAFAALTLLAVPARAQYPATPQIRKAGVAVVVEDYADVPISSRYLTNVVPPYGIQLGRVSFLRSEPSNAPLSAVRFFVTDMNRNLYLLDKSTRAFSAYLNFERVFPKFDNDSGYAAGLVTFAFDPDYATNGKFFTVHTEDPAISGSAMPTNGAYPALDLTGYSLTTVVTPPAGTIMRHGVLVEWTDTNVSNSTFEGTARELLRVGYTSVIHPVGDLLFNPLAHPGDSDYRNLYLVAGDNGTGETAGSTHTIPQRLDTLLGKVLRITPDLSLRPADMLSANGRYRIPTTGADPNPFVNVSLSGLKKEIYAYGFRNPHRFSWDPVSNKLILTDIGLDSWEEVNIVTKGGNYGYAEREGIEQLFVGGANNSKTGSQTTPPTPFPGTDSLVVTGLVSTVTPIYPVLEYSHRDGDAISSGFVYRGELMPWLRGKYVFGEISTGRLLYCDLAEMMATDDGVRTNVATIRELQVVFNGVARRLFDVARDKFAAKGGVISGHALPNSAPVTNGTDPDGVPYGVGRVDLRLALGGDGEIYLLSKADGMVRKLTSVIVPPTIQTVKRTNGVAVIVWPSISNYHYRVQFKASVVSTNWTDLVGDITATNGTSAKTDPAADAARYYRVVVLP